MRKDASPYDVLRRTFWSGGDPIASDPGMRRIADCISELRAAVARLGRANGDRAVIWALTAMMVDIALKDRHPENIATIFRTNAQLLEVQAATDQRTRSRWPSSREMHE